MWRLPYLVIKIYQRLLSPLLPPACRFTPSCSHYSAEAMKTHGFWRGSTLSFKRIIRCNPWCEGGHDPVPPAHPENKDTQE
ncbi:MAG: membrane protein insertion efficiency factor YidD [Gammaproteobacteria bacterium]|nr:membrane protein insertion efficiency factor YidD [Gammaproteobacteria bacterium]MCP4799702.1 membrane protein insertion efficiency factor YidD [bacterium]